MGALLGQARTMLEELVIDTGGTPVAVQQRISDAVALAVNNETFVRAQTDAGIQIVKDERRTPAGHRAFLHRELARWTPVIQAAGVYAD